MGDQRNLKMKISLMRCGIILILAQSVIVTVVLGKITETKIEYNNTAAQALINRQIDQYEKYVQQHHPVLKHLPPDAPHSDRLDNIWLAPYIQNENYLNHRYQFHAGFQTVAGLSKPIVTALSKSNFRGYRNGERRSCYYFWVRYSNISINFSWKLIGGPRGSIRPETPCKGTYKVNLINSTASGRIWMKTDNKNFPTKLMDVKLEIPPIEQWNIRNENRAHCRSELLNFVNTQLADFEDKYLRRLNETITPIARAKLLTISKKLIELQINSTLNRNFR